MLERFKRGIFAKESGGRASEDSNIEREREKKKRDRETVIQDRKRENYALTL